MVLIHCMYLGELLHLPVYHSLSKVKFVKPLDLLVEQLFAVLVVCRRIRLGSATTNNSLYIS